MWASCVEWGSHTAGKMCPLQLQECAYQIVDRSCESPDRVVDRDYVASKGDVFILWYHWSFLCEPCVSILPERHMLSGQAGTACGQQRRNMLSRRYMCVIEPFFSTVFLDMDLIICTFSTIFCFMIYVSFKKPCPFIANRIGMDWIGSIFGPNLFPW